MNNYETMKTTLRHGFTLLLATLVLTGCERPPVQTEQNGFRGVGIVQNINPRTEEAKLAANAVPEAPPAAPDGGPAAGAIFKNVQVLDDLSVAQFTRLMTSITQWVAPEEGCAYCHDLTDLSSDAVYTKQVARSMLRMTRDTNQNWQTHVGNTGVTCYTCHRGNSIPTEVWSKSPPQAHARGIDPTMQNIASSAVGYTSLPFDPLSGYLDGDGKIRVVAGTALPETPGSTIQKTEQTYGLMVHISDSLGVNCTFCHNSRSFTTWEQSPPQRETAWHGIQMVRHLNQTIDEVADLLPENRKGPLGDPYKIGCATCHQGVNKPLYGVSMLPDYPSLASGE